MLMGPLRRDRCVSWIDGSGLERKDRVASGGIVAASRSGGGNMGTR